MKKMLSVISNGCETTESHSDESLRSHYYKTTVKKAMETVKELIEKQQGFTITSYSDERGEMSVKVNKGKKALMIITIISIRPYETAVDLIVTTETKLPIDFGFSKRIIKGFYIQLNQKLPFIGTGLNR
ncbi:cytosolic protein [Bacillus timonensis]|nr:cytosolic protein [Bacillus timonensis]